MKRILVIDDSENRREVVVAWLSSAGYIVETVSEVVVPKLISRCKQLMSANVFDLLILDINFNRYHDGDDWGGIWFYNRLRREGFAERWRRVVIYSKYAGSTTASAISGDQLVVKVFMDTAGIPNEAIVHRDTGNREVLLAKVQELIGPPS